MQQLASPKVSVKPSKVKQNGVILNSKCESQTVLAEINQKSFISLSNIMKWKLNDMALEKALEYPEISERLSIMIFILYLRFNPNVAKEWVHYILSLPQECDTPITWDSEINLKRCGLYSAVKSKMSRLRNEFNKLEPNLKFLGNMTLNDYIWADFIFWSRVISLKSANGHINGDDLCLIPLLDFCNHSLSPNASWELDSESKTISLVSSREIQADEEVTISYGQKSNCELLFIYGFAIEENPLNSFSIIPPFIDYQNETSEFLENKMEIWRRIGIEQMITINSPNVLDFNNDSEMFANPTTGILSDSNLIGMCLCVLLEDDPIQFSKSGLQSLSDLKQILSSNSEFLDVLFLRVFKVLHEAVQFHFKDINDLSECDGVVRIAQNGILKALKEAENVFDSLMTNLMEKEHVQAYLS